MELSADTATWIAVGVAATAALIVLMLLLVLRARRRSARELAEATVDEVRRYVEQALERRAEERPPEFRRPDARLRRLSQVTTTVELDEVLDRTLRAATELSGAAAAMVALEVGGELLLRTVGLSADEVGRQPLGLPPAAADARALELEYRYTEEEAANDEFRLRRGLSVPVRALGGPPLGTITVFWRRIERSLSDEDIGFLEELGGFLVPAVANARRLVEARAAAWTDEATRLPNRRYFEDALRRECSRARRYNHSLTLLVLDVNGGEADTGLTAAAERLSAGVRASDIACRVGPGELALVLPETALADAEAAYRRIEPAVQAQTRQLAAGIAELEPHDDPLSLLERAEAAVRAAPA